MGVGPIVARPTRIVSLKSNTFRWLNIEASQNLDTRITLAEESVHLFAFLLALFVEVTIKLLVCLCRT